MGSFNPSFIVKSGESVAAHKGEEHNSRYFSIIDSKDTPQEQICKLQAKIWQLESENTILNTKLMQMVDDREKREIDLKNINNVLLGMVKDLGPLTMP